MSTTRDKATVTQVLIAISTIAKKLAEKINSKNRSNENESPKFSKNH